MSAAVDESVARYEVGELSQGDLFGELWDHLRTLGVDELLAGLPADIREGFTRWLRHMYDNELGPGDYVYVSNAGRTPADDEELVRRVRTWIRTSSGPDDGSATAAGPDAG